MSFKFENLELTKVYYSETCMHTYSQQNSQVATYNPV